MKRVRGLTLQAVLAGDGLVNVERFTTRRLLGAFVSLCLAVDFAHSRGVIHRDLKPSNVMLGDFGEIYLLDWGVAKLSDDPEDGRGPVVDAGSMASTPIPETAAGTIVGTPAYMAPEQVCGEVATVRSDVFALGAMLFELLAGTPLRDAKATFASMAMGRHDARFSVRTPERHIAPELEAICVRATAVDQGQRFASARALAEAVEKFLEGDRDLLLRRELAEAHLRGARELIARPAHAGSASTTVMRELGSALALDPENPETRALVVEALTSVPAELPDEVREAIARRAHESLVESARSLPVILGTWLLFGPIVYLAGVKNVQAIAGGVGLMAVATMLGLARVRRMAGAWLDYAAIGCSALAMASVGLTFSPFVVAPTLLATLATAAQLHPNPKVCRTALVLCVTTLVGSVVLELGGVLAFPDPISPAVLLLGPRDVHALPITAVIVMMNVVATITTALTVANVRRKLTHAEERVLLHAWQVRGLLPATVAERTTERPPVSS